MIIGEVLIREVSMRTRKEVRRVRAQRKESFSHSAVVRASAGSDKEL